MRLLFLSSLYPPHDLGGLENRCQETAVRLQRRGHSVCVLTSRYGVPRGSSEQSSIIRTLYLQADVNHYQPRDFFVRRRRQERANMRELQQATEQFKPDLIVIWGMWNLSRWLPYWAEQWMPGRVAYIIGSYWPADIDIHIEYWQSPARRSLTELIKRPLRALALSQLRREGYPPPLSFRHAMCCSQYVRDTLVQAGRLPASTGVLYGGIDPEPFLRNLGLNNGMDDQSLRLLYFGSLLSHKGVHTAIEALGLLKQRGLMERVELTILGGGHPEYVARLRAMVARLEIGDRIHFAGRVLREEIPSWLGRFDVFLFTSIWPEPFGRTIIEAMASGLVVIGSDVGGSREIFRHYTEELLFQPGDSCGLADRIVRVIEDPSLRQRLVPVGQQTVLERFTLDRMVVDIEQWLQEVAG